MYPGGIPPSAEPSTATQNPASTDKYESRLQQVSLAFPQEYSGPALWHTLMGPRVSQVSPALTQVFPASERASLEASEALVGDELELQARRDAASMQAPHR